jgi:hypothetical protein
MGTNPIARFSARTEALAMRLNPATKYMADLASRQDRRSLTNFVEWAIGQALSKVKLTVNKKEISAADATDLLWDVDEVERLRKLMEHCPDLLRYKDQVLLSLINGFSTKDLPQIRFSNGGVLDWPLVKTCWDDLEALAENVPGAESKLTAALQAARPAVKAPKAAKHK